MRPAQKKTSLKTATAIATGIFCLLVAESTMGLELRDGDLADNLRFLNFPAAPTPNESFIHKSHVLSGVAWQASDHRKQLALVSPRHFVGANHFRPGVGSELRFLGSDQQVYTYTVSGEQAVMNAANEDTDLFLGTLSTAVDTTQISPTPYLNLASEAAYPTLPMLIFGKTILGADARVDGIVDFAGFSVTNNAPINNTRMITFVYQNLVGGNNDGNLQPGDSGSPAFAVLNGKAGLVGTNSAILTTAAAQTNLCAFLPFYASEINAIMGDEGYRLIKHTAVATTVAASTTPLGTLRQGYPGQIKISLENTGLADAENLSLTLSVGNATHLPDTLSGSGWFGGMQSSTSREQHRATLPLGATSDLTLMWNALPPMGSLELLLEWEWDGGSTQNATATHTLLPSYRVWSSGLTDKALTGNPDFDELVNLLEYASGGDPKVNATRSAGGDALTPYSQPSPNGDRIKLRYRRRTDFAERALTYQPEFNPTLPGTWTNTLPDGTLVSTETAADAGFEIVVLDVPTPAARLFFQVRVELNE